MVKTYDLTRKIPDQTLVDLQALKSLEFEQTLDFQC
ncbi:MAG: hypothetical protein ACI959_001101 [Limisphaerales bacterium]|jgi:hypothetical protein